MTADTTKNVTASTADSAASVAPAATSGTNDSDLWQPVIKELKAFNTAQNTDNASLWYIFFMGIVGGLVALLTPCVWPIIPMTVSFFLKRAKDDPQERYP